MINGSAHTLGRSAIWSLLNQLAGQFLVLAVFFITARFVSKEAFGIVATCLMIVEVFRQILIESISTTFAAKKSPTDADYTAGFHVLFFGGILSAVIVLILAKPASILLGHPEISIALQWTSLLLLVSGIAKIQEIWLGKHFNFRLLAIRSIISICVGGGVGIWLAVNGYGITSLIAQQIITACTAAICLWATIPWKPSFKMHWINIKSLLKSTKHIFLDKAVNVSGTQSDIFFSAYYLGPAATGIYNAGKRVLAAITMIISGGVNSVAFPALAGFEGDPERQRRAFLKIVFMTSLLTAPLFVGAAVLSYDIIDILMGEKWLDVVPIFAILCISGYIQSLSQYNSNILFIKDKSHWLFYISVVGVMSNILLLIIFAKNGLIALAIAQTARTILFYPYTTYLALNHLSISVSSFIKEVWVSVLSAIVMGIVIVYGRQYYDFGSYLNIAIYVPSGFIVYSVLAIVLAPTKMIELGRYSKEILNKGA